MTLVMTLGLEKKASKSPVLEEADMQPMTPVLNSALDGLEGKSFVPGAAVKHSNSAVVKPLEIEGMIKQSYVLMMA